MHSLYRELPGSRDRQLAILNSLLESSLIPEPMLDRASEIAQRISADPDLFLGDGWIERARSHELTPEDLEVLNSLYLSDLARQRNAKQGRSVAQLQALGVLGIALGGFLILLLLCDMHLICE